VLPHQSAQQHLWYDLDMERLEDEQLVVLVQECGYVPARDELISRCNGLKDRVIHRRAARSGLQEADRMDAQQDAVLWILEAIREYNTRQHVLPQGCRFRTFLYRVLLSRFVDLLRRQRRRQARLRVGGYTFGSLGSPAALQRDGSSTGHEGRGSEPQRGMERDELMARLHHAVDRLGGHERELWELLVRGMRLREIAAAFHLSYDAVKRQRRKLIAHLSVWLGEE
jgi:RNA polymerase sigma factor (sigma-70 family)